MILVVRIKTSTFSKLGHPPSPVILVVQTIGPNISYRLLPNFAPKLKSFKSPSRSVMTRPVYSTIHRFFTLSNRDWVTSYNANTNNIKAVPAFNLSAISRFRLDFGYFTIDIKWTAVAVVHAYTTTRTNLYCNVLNNQLRSQIRSQNEVNGHTRLVWFVNCELIDYILF